MISECSVSLPTNDNHLSPPQTTIKAFQVYDEYHFLQSVSLPPPNPHLGKWVTSCLHIMLPGILLQTSVFMNTMLLTFASAIKMLTGENLKLQNQCRRH